MGMTRRELVRAGLLVAGGTAAAGGAVLHGRLRAAPEDPRGPATVRRLPEDPGGVAAASGEDVLVRMQRDLARAMARPAEERRWAMLIDRRRCVGCHACTVGCIAENRLPPGVVYRPVLTAEVGRYPQVGLSFTPRPCMQCEQPPCVPVCPVRATWRRPDGVTVIDYDLCIGCRYCLAACPYGARTSDFGEDYVEAIDGAERVLGGPAVWERQASREYAKAWSRGAGESPVGNARKCHFCLHRLDVGQLPICVSTCIGRATLFGDLADPDALIVERLRTETPETLLAHLGTRPRVFYVG